MTSGEPLPLSTTGQAIVSRVQTSPKQEFYTFYCSGSLACKVIGNQVKGLNVQ